jgi:uncharacterized protein (TIGR03083 family)
MIDTIPLIASLHDELIELLSGLAPEQWGSSTACPGWTVKDVTAHLLDGNQRRLSICRDGQRVAFSGGAVGRSLNELNSAWVQAARRLSPRLLIDLHKLVGPQIITFWRSLDPHGIAFFPVEWAGESQSEVWFDCARDFTEQWHHQQQIREATGTPSLITPTYFPIVLSILMHCVPPAYADLALPMPATVQITAAGNAGGVWSITRGDSGWIIQPGDSISPQCRIEMPQRDVWLLFTKKLTPSEAESRATIIGDRRLAQPFFQCKAVMG